MSLKSVSVQRANYIKVINRSHPIGVLGQHTGSGRRFQQFTIARGSFAPPLVPFGKAAQLYMENAGLQRVESAVIPFHLVIIFSQLAVVPEHADLLGYVLVIRGDSSRLTAGPEVLTGIKAGGGGSS